MQIKLCWQHNFICIICYFYVFMPRKNKPKCSDNEKQSISRINTFLNKKTQRRLHISKTWSRRCGLILASK